MIAKKLIHVAVVPGVDRQLRVLAALHGVHQGEALAGLLALAAMRPTDEVAAALAAQDQKAGELVPDGVSEAQAVKQARAEGLAVAEDF